MSPIPISVTGAQFEEYIRPCLRVAKRGYVCKIPLYKVFNYVLYRLHTGCQWAQLPIAREAGSGRREISHDAVYYHYLKWSGDGSLAQVFEASVVSIRAELDCHHLNRDGSHALAKKGGEAVAYQGRKKAKTSNVLPITDANGFIVASSEIVAGNHHDAFDLKDHLRAAFKFINRLGISIAGSYFNADAAFDTHTARRTCFNYKLRPNIPENQRARKRPKRGRKRLFNPQVYKLRFKAEWTFAWIDKFRALFIRFDRKAGAHFMGAHFIVFALINLRHRLADEKF